MSDGSGQSRVCIIKKRLLEACSRKLFSTCPNIRPRLTLSILLLALASATLPKSFYTATAIATATLPRCFTISSSVANTTGQLTLVNTACKIKEEEKSPKIGFIRCFGQPGAFGQFYYHLPRCSLSQPPGVPLNKTGIILYLNTDLLALVAIWQFFN